MRRLAAAAAMLLALAAAAPAQAGAVAALREFLAQTRTARGEFTQQVTRGGAQAAPPSTSRCWWPTASGCSSTTRTSTR
ncbi:MAG: hypothetical protein H6R03_657 [Burkholderiaceae bacterium]|nr:hypothetical protein [Burkholderiaceae bacterium]